MVGRDRGSSFRRVSLLDSTADFSIRLVRRPRKNFVLHQDPLKQDSVKVSKSIFLRSRRPVRRDHIGRTPHDLFR